MPVFLKLCTISQPCCLCKSQARREYELPASPAPSSLCPPAPPLSLTLPMISITCPQHSLITTATLNTTAALTQLWLCLQLLI